MQIAMVQDAIVPLENIDHAYLDRGLYFGDGVYEVLRSYNGRIFALEEHLQRFDRSLREIGIDNVDIADIRRRVLLAFDTAAIPDARIYFHITRGSGPRYHGLTPGLIPNFLLTVQHLHDSSAEKSAGIRVSSYPDQRWKRCDIKSLNLLPNVMARIDAQRKGCDEAILVDENGIITEGSASAFFAVVDGMLRTTPIGMNILPSVTRKYVFMAAEAVGLPIQERSVTPVQALAAQELFLGVTTKDIVPIVMFDGIAIANGKPGPWTLKLMAQFQAYVG